MVEPAAAAGMVVQETYQMVQVMMTVVAVEVQDTFILLVPLQIIHLDVYLIVHTI